MSRGRGKAARMKPNATADRQGKGGKGSAGNELQHARKGRLARLTRALVGLHGGGD